MLRKWGLALAGVVMIGAAARAVDLDERHTVRPGEGIGVIKLGMTVPQVHDAMKAWGAKPMLVSEKTGGPAAWMDEQAGAAIEAYQTDPLGRDRYGNVMKVFYVKNLVAQIATQSVAYATSKGANVRMSSLEFKAVHPSLHATPVRASWGGNVRAYDSDRMGLAVTYSVLSNGSEARTAQEILVHNPGAQVLLESPRHAGNISAPAVDNTKSPSGPTGDNR